MCKSPHWRPCHEVTLAPVSLRRPPVTRLRSLFVLTPILGACSVVSLPPSSSRSDGGPVATRGAVIHEARSQLRLYRDAAGCESVQTVNRQYRLVTVRDSIPGDGPRRLVLEESYDVRHCLAAESQSSEATVTVWRPDSVSREPLFRLAGRGVHGEPWGNLYQMVAAGCCGSQNLITYYSLLSGATLFASSLPARILEFPANRTSLFVGFHDTYSAAAPVEASDDSSVVGVVSWADDHAVLQRVVVVADRAEPLAVAALAFTRDGRRLADTLVTVWPNDSTADFAVTVDLISPASDRRAWIRIPIANRALVIEKAVASRGFRVRQPR